MEVAVAAIGQIARVASAYRPQRSLTLAMSSSGRSILSRSSMAAMSPCRICRSPSVALKLN